MIMIIPLLVIFIIMGFLIIKAQEDELKKMGAMTLTGINDNIVNIVYSSIHQQDVAMRNAQYMIAMKKLMTHEPLLYRDYIFMNSIINYLTSAQTSYRFIDSIYMYMDEVDNFLSSNLDALATFKTYYDEEWLEYYKDMPQEDKYLFESRTLQKHSYEEAENVITIFQRMSYAKGVIVLNVKSNHFGERISDLLNPGQSFYFLNKSGNILHATEGAFLIAETEIAETFKDIVMAVDKNGDFLNNEKWVKINDKSYLINILSDDYQESYLVSMISYESFLMKQYDFIKLALLILVFTLTIVLFLSWMTTRSAFRHINYLIEVFRRAEKGEPVGTAATIVKDEYNLILNNILFLFIKNNQMQTKLIEKNHQTQIAEMMALQLQINPHFIFNTLQTMDLEVLKILGGGSTLHQLIQLLSSIMKYALTNPTEFVSLKEELNYLKAYLEILEVRLGNNIITYYEIDEELYEFSVFRLMLQPVIENCVNHGLRGTNERLYIKIKVKKLNESIHFSVIDNGRGITKDRLAELKIKINDRESLNIGLTNLNQRLILHYGEKSRLQILSKESIGTAIRFKIPIDNKNDDESL